MADIGDELARPFKTFADIYGPAEPSMAYGAFCNSPADLLGTFLPYAILSFGVVVFFYMLGKILKSEHLRKYLEIELYDILLFTLLIVTLIPFLYYFNCFSFLVGSISTYDAGYIYWDSMSRNLALDGFLLQVSSAVFMPVLTADISLGSTNGVALAGFSMAIKSFLSNTFTLLSITLSLTYAFKYLYQFLTYGLVSSLIPLGIALRAIPFTKKLGGTLFGLALGMAFFLPIISAMMLHAVNGIMTLTFNPKIGAYEANPETFLSVVNDALLSVFEFFAPSDVVNALSTGAVSQASAISGLPNTEARGFFTDLSDPDSYEIAYSSSSLARVTAVVSTASTILGKVASTASSRATNSRLSRFLTGLSSGFATLSSMAIFLTALSIAFMISLEITVVTATTFIAFAILITTIKVFTGMFGEPLDVSNLTRLV